MATDPIPSDIQTEIERLKIELVRMVLFEIHQDEDSQFARVRLEISTAIGREVKDQLTQAIPKSALATAGTALDHAGSRATELSARLDAIRNEAVTAAALTSQLSNPLVVICEEIAAIGQQLATLREQASRVQIVAPPSEGNFIATIAPPAEQDQPVNWPVPLPSPPSDPEPKGGHRWLGVHWNVWAPVGAFLLALAAMFAFAILASDPSRQVDAQPLARKATRDLAGTMLAAGARLDERIRVAGEPDVTDLNRPIGPPMGRVSAGKLAQSLSQVTVTADALARNLSPADPRVADLSKLARQLDQVATDVRGYAETGSSQAQWAPGDVLAISTRLRGIAERQLALRVAPDEIPVRPFSSPSPSPLPSPSPGVDG